MDLGILNSTPVMLLLPFVAALVSPLIMRIFGASGAWLLALFPASIFIHLIGFLDVVSAGDSVTGGIDWVPSIGVNFSWFFDGLSLTFGLLITGIGTLIILYAGGYMKGHKQIGRFIAFLFLFMGAMLGLVACDNIFAFFIFWELTSITSFLLIGFDHNKEASRRAALQALVVTGGGGLILMAGVIVLQGVTGFSEFSLIVTSGDVIRESPFYLLIFFLVLGGAFTKSAQFPLHFWLPNAMEAPTPVSAYLHSATMVKAGVYLLMRMNPVLGGTEIWETVLPLVGGITLFFGTLLAVRQTDLKLMLAYTTVASLGLLVMLTGWGNEKAIEAAVYYLVAHSLFKGGLFMVAGAIDHEAGTRNVNKLGGLRKAMPITFVAACLGGLSMGGLPPFLGFLAKEEIYAGMAAVDLQTTFLLVLAIISNALMLVIGAVVAIKPFLGASVKTPKPAHEAPILMLAGPVLLGIVGLVSAIFATLTNGLLISPMSSAVAGTDIVAHMVLKVKFSLPLYLSLLTIALGIFLYLKVDMIRNWMALILWKIGWGPDHGFDQFIRGIIRLATFVTRKIQTGKLDTYMKVTFATVAVALFYPLLAFGELPKTLAFSPLRFHEWGFFLLAFIGLVAVLFAANRLTAILALGIQGFAVAVLFMLFGAPDLSFTQFMVETLSVVILALVMTRIKLTPADSRSIPHAIVDMTIAFACALGFTLVLLSVLEVPFNNELSDFFIENSFVIAHGRNIVNVILVDFRGVDTLGEIGVVMVAGLGILALIRMKPKQVPGEDGV